MKCVCPYESTNPKPGPYARKAFINRLNSGSVRETADVVQLAKKEAALELDFRKKLIKELQATTRVHVCSPHTYIIDAAKC
jgi:hypothetical protein